MILFWIQHLQEILIHQLGHLGTIAAKTQAIVIKGIELIWLLHLKLSYGL